MNKVWFVVGGHLLFTRWHVDALTRVHTRTLQTWQNSSSEARPPAASPLTQRLIINLIMFSQSCFLITLILLCAWTGWRLMSSGTVEQGWALSWTFTRAPTLLLLLFSTRWTFALFALLACTALYWSTHAHKQKKKNTSWKIASLAFV